MNGVLERAAALLDRRFILNALLPLVIASTLLLVLVGHSLGDLPLWLGLWARLDALTQALAIFAGIVTNWFLAGVLSSQYRNITQAFEGYPLMRAAWLRPAARPLVEYHLHRRNTLRKSALGAETAYYAYPRGRRDEFLPTALGNALRSAEYYPKDRYGAPTTFMWPRLAYLAPERFRQDVAQFRTDYEWLLGVSFLSAAVATVTGLAQLVLGAAPLLFAATFGGGMLVSLAAYRAAVSSAVEYGAQLRAGVDLYRTEVLRHLRWPLPHTERQEQEMWAEVTRVHMGGEPRVGFYAPPPPPPATDQPA